MQTTRSSWVSGAPCVSDRVRGVHDARVVFVVTGVTDYYWAGGMRRGQVNAERAGEAGGPSDPGGVYGIAGSTGAGGPSGRAGVYGIAGSTGAGGPAGRAGSSDITKIAAAGLFFW